MTKKMLGRVFIGLMITTGMAFAVTNSHVHELCEGFLPENDMKIPVGMWSQGGISQEKFNQAMDRLDEEYRAEVEAGGLVLKINRLWTNETVNASAQRMGSTQVLNMYGGLARHPAITYEGFALVLCHEYGHHNGGAPKNAGWFSSWATNEGGSDYFATSKCLRRVFSKDDNEAIVAENEALLDPVAVAGCQSQWPNHADRLLCMRISLAGQSVANLFADMKKDTKPPRFDTPDTSEVSRTNDSHPATQCRLDTYLAGMLCTVAESEKPSDTNYRDGSCYSPRDAVGVRSRCWFAPN